MIYNLNEKAQVFVDLSEDRILYENFLGGIDRLGIYSIQINVKKINENTEKNLLDILKMPYKSIILNINCNDVDKFKIFASKFTSITVDYTYDEIYRSSKEVYFPGNNYGVRINYFQNCEYDILAKKLMNIKNAQYIILNPCLEENGRISMKSYAKEEVTIKKLIHNMPVPTILDNGFFEKDYILNHPCNIYLCSGHKCHTGKGGTLRRIHINKDGDIYPEELVSNSKYCIGNIGNGILKDILNTERFMEQNTEFIELCRKVYHYSIVNTSSNIIPFKYLIRDVEKLSTTKI